MGPNTPTSMSSWFQLADKFDSLSYGAGPLLWGVLAFTEIRAYPSSLSLAIQLGAISCLYSILALACQMVASSKKSQSRENTTTPAFEAMFSLTDLRQDPRYLILALVSFMKMWLNLRLLKSADSVSSFFFLSYSDTFVQVIVDQFFS